MKDIEEFKGGVDLYSADLSLWPTEKIKPALAFMQENSAAKAYFDDMAAAETLLRAYAADVSVSPGLEDKIMHRLTQSPAKVVPLPAARNLINWRPQHFLAPGGGILAVLLLGVFVGFGPLEMEYRSNDATTHAVGADPEYLPFIWEEAE